MSLDLQIGNPGDLVLPDCKIPVLRLKVRRNQQGQIQDLVIHLDPSSKVREKLKSHKSVPLELRGTGERIEIDVPSEFCGWHEGNAILGVQHLHQTKVDQSQIEKIERFLEKIASRQMKTAQ